jgi:hypothetical protein
MRFSANGVDCLIENLCSCTLCSIATARAVTHTHVKKKKKKYIVCTFVKLSRAAILEKEKEKKKKKIMSVRIASGFQNDTGSTIIFKATCSVRANTLSLSL